MKRILIIGITLLNVFYSNAQHDMGTGDLSSCTGTLRDVGGSANYGDNLDITETYCSNAGNCIDINFTSFLLENNYDFLYIYDGASTSDPIIGTYTGGTSPGNVSSSTGCITFRFTSDVNTNTAGWEATISCTACPTCDPPSALGTTTIGGFDAQLSWTENGSATTWDVELGTTGFAPTGTPTENDVTSNPAYVSGLTSTTTYDYYVRADCGGLTSTWTGPHTFTTTTLPPGSTCGDPYMLTLPYSANFMNTSGFGDNYNSTHACASSYLDGDDYVMEYTPSSDECITINLHNMNQSYGSLFLLDGCPDNGSTNCISMQRGTFITGAGLTDVVLTGGNTYYIVISSDPFGGQTMQFDLDITGGACPTCTDGIRNGDEDNVDCGGASCPACTGGTCADAFDIPSLPYRSQNNTTENMGDNYNASHACGSAYMTGNDYVYKYTANAADTCVTIALEELSRFATGVFLLDGCPDAGTTTCVASTIENVSAPQNSLYIYNQQLTAGQDYYVVVSSNASNTQTTDFNFNMVNYCGAPDCGTNDPADDLCTSATYLDNLNGFCGNTSSTYTVSANEPTAFCASIENNSWLTFTADSTSAIIDVYVEDCIGGRGIQIEIYETADCINFNSVSNCWNPAIEVNGSVTASGLTVGADYYIMVDGFGGDVCNYTIQAVDGIEVILSLVSISNFTIDCISNNNILEWKIDQSNNKPDVYVQKSLDGKSFETLDKININGKTKYSFIDYNTSGEKEFYRLKQIGIDGKESFTKTISNTCSNSHFDVDIYPNPVKDIVSVSTSIKKIQCIQIMDVQGKEVLFLSDLDSKTTQIDLTTLTKGIYFMKVTNENANQEIRKIVK